MPRFRLLLAWLMMAALPLQGWAAASMLYCGPAQRAAVHGQAGAPAASQPAHHDMDAAHHDMDAAHHDMDAAHHDMDAAHHETQVAHHAAHLADGGATADASDHSCGVCASCCHGVALAQTPRWDTAQPVPAAHIAEPLVALLARPSGVPDKPPRA